MFTAVSVTNRTSSPDWVENFFSERSAGSEGRSKVFAASAADAGIGAKAAARVKQHAAIASNGGRGSGNKRRMYSRLTIARNPSRETAGKFSGTSLVQPISDVATSVSEWIGSAPPLSTCWRSQLPIVHSV